VVCKLIAYSLQRKLFRERNIKISEYLHGVKMTNKYLLLVVVIVSGVMVLYGVYSYYTIGDSSESLINENGNNTTNGYNETDMHGLNESNNNNNRTNRSTASISIPLEKPPFIE